ncbi:hypothetical protein YTPLAS73_13070 [Nitrosarchaeum sp.]|nr:hypothetical protein YTPLAS73_13070 [Nitrosarchaeum sp.]
MSKRDALITTAFVQGISIAILMRFNIDISPAGILKMIFPALEPLVIEQIKWIIPIFLLILALLPIVSIIVIIQKHGWKGLAVYVIIAFVAWYIVMFY